MTGHDLAALGSALFGAQWQAPLARALGVNPRLIARLRSGREEIGAALAERLARLATEERAAAIDRAAAISAALARAGILPSTSEIFPAKPGKPL